MWITIISFGCSTSCLAKSRLQNLLRQGMSKHIISKHTKRAKFSLLETSPLKSSSSAVISLHQNILTPSSSTLNMFSRIFLRPRLQMRKAPTPKITRRTFSNQRRNEENVTVTTMATTFSSSHQVLLSIFAVMTLLLSLVVPTRSPSRRKRRKSTSHLAITRVEIALLNFSVLFNSRWLKLDITTSDVVTNCEDLKVLGKGDFKALMKWRTALREELGLDVKTNATEELTETVEVTGDVDPEVEIEEEVRSRLFPPTPYTLTLIIFSCSIRFSLCSWNV